MVALVATAMLAGCGRLGFTDMTDGGAGDVSGDTAPDTEPGGCAIAADFTPCSVVTIPDRGYDVCIAGVCQSPGCGDASCNVRGPSGGLADTNQRACFDATVSIACNSLPAPGSVACETTVFCGQDAQLGWDATNPATARFSRAAVGVGEFVVVDNVTGMMWQSCASGQTDDCVGAASNLTWADAVATCDALTFAGLDDWHLPSTHEVQPILDYSRVFNAIDDVVFPNPAVTTWLSDSAANPSDAWYVEFPNPQLNISPKSMLRPLRCVRTATPPAARARNRFVRSTGGDPIVTDSWTGLAWQGCPKGLSDDACATGTVSSLQWDSALDACVDSTWGGRTDWVLPDIGELHSLVDQRFVNPAIDPAAFPAFPAGPYASSTTRGGTTQWRVLFDDGTTNGGAGKVAISHMLCVAHP